MGGLGRGKVIGALDRWWALGDRQCPPDGVVTLQPNLLAHGRAHTDHGLPTRHADGGSVLVPVDFHEHRWSLACPYLHGPGQVGQCVHGDVAPVADSAASVPAASTWAASAMARMPAMNPSTSLVFISTTAFMSGT